MAAWSLEIPVKLSDWRKSRDSKKNNVRDSLVSEIKRCVCALLNSGGGALTIKLVKENGNLAAADSLKDNCLESDDVIKPVEQFFFPAIGTAGVSNYLKICSEVPSAIVCEVKGYWRLCSLHCNMFLPTDTQAVAVRPDEVDAVKNLLNPAKIVDLTDFCRPFPNEFVLASAVCFRESKTVQFKKLKSQKSQGNDLGSRIINNRFTDYVSAFANHCGGRMFIGIDKKGVVVGQKIASNERNALISKLEMHIYKMKWPEYCIPIRLGKQWEVAFAKVVDEQGSECCELSVIVVTIPRCPGGVFTKEPESYHIVDGKVEEIDFETWKSRLLYPNDNNRTQRSLSRCDWSSRKLRKMCDYLDGELLRNINCGKWHEFERKVGVVEDVLEKFPNALEMRLVLLSKWYVFHYRRGEPGDMEAANNCLEKFNEIVDSSKDRLIFYVRGQLIRSALERTSGDVVGSYTTAKECLCDVEKLSPCILTVEFYAHFATVLSIIEGKAELRDQLKGDFPKFSIQEQAMLFYNKALEHLQKVDYVPLSKADMEQKTYINIAIMKLGCSLSGDVVDRIVDTEAIQQAHTCLDRVNESVTKYGHPLSGFRKCQYLFAMSSLHYRRSQHETMARKRARLLESALDEAEDVESLATRLAFYEMRRYAEKHGDFYRTCLSELQSDDFLESLFGC